MQEYTDKLKLFNDFGGVLYAHVQPFLQDSFTNVDGSVCAKFPEESRHPRVVFNCQNGTYPGVEPDRCVLSFPSTVV